jgi:hypothetical protein
MSNRSIPEPSSEGRIVGAKIPTNQCPSCHLISSVVPMGIGFASYWYGLKYWSLKERFEPNARIWVPYKVKIPILAMGSFGLVGYGVYRLFWKEPGTPGLF